MKVFFVKWKPTLHLNISPTEKEDQNQFVAGWGEIIQKALNVGRTMPKGDGFYAKTGASFGALKPYAYGSVNAQFLYCAVFFLAMRFIMGFIDETCIEHIWTALFQSNL